MTETWPGTAYPLGATFDGSGTNFALFSEVAERVELCLFDDERRRTRDPRRADRGRRLRVALLPARRSSRASATATACTARTTPSNGLRCNPNKLLLDPYAKATSGDIDWDQSLFGYNFGDPDCAQRRRLRRAHDARRGHQPVLRLGGRPPPRRSPTTSRSSTRRTSRASPSCTPTSPRSSAARTPASRTRSVTDAPHEARRHRHRADAGAPVRPGQHAARQGPAQLLGLQHPRLLRAARRLRRQRRARPAGAGVQGDGARRCTPPASRSSSTWSTTTPPRATTSARR